MKIKILFMGILTLPLMDNHVFSSSLPAEKSLSRESSSRYSQLSSEYMDLIKRDLIAHKEAGGDPKSFVFVFDVHGVLTSHANPDESARPEYARVRIVNFLKELKRLGATVVISSAWSDPARTAQSVRAAGLGDLLSKEITITPDYLMGAMRDVVYIGPSVISVKDDTSASYFYGKALAGILAARDVEINRLYLFDDSERNLNLFLDQVERIQGRHSPGMARFEAVPVKIASLSTYEFSINAQCDDLSGAIPNGAFVEFFINGTRIASLPLAVYNRRETIVIKDRIAFDGNELDQIQLTYRIVDKNGTASETFNATGNRGSLISLIEDGNVVNGITVELSQSASSAINTPPIRMQLTGVRRAELAIPRGVSPALISQSGVPLPVYNQRNPLDLTAAPKFESLLKSRQASSNGANVSSDDSQQPLSTIKRPPFSLGAMFKLPGEETRGGNAESVSSAGAGIGGGRVSQYNPQEAFDWNAFAKKQKLIFDNLNPEFTIFLKQDFIDPEKELEINQKLIESLPHLPAKVTKFNKPAVQYLSEDLQARNNVLETKIVQKEAFLVQENNREIYAILSKYNFDFKSSGVMPRPLSSNRLVKSVAAYFQPTEEEFAVLSARISHPGMQDAINALRTKLPREESFNDLYMRLERYLSMRPEQFMKTFDSISQQKVLTNKRLHFGILSRNVVSAHKQLKIISDVLNKLITQQRGNTGTLRVLQEDVMADIENARALTISIESTLSQSLPLEERVGDNILDVKYASETTPTHVRENLHKFDLSPEAKEVLFEQGKEKLTSKISVEGYERKVHRVPHVVQDDVPFIMNILNNRLYILPFESQEGFHHHHILGGGAIDAAGIVTFRDGKIYHISADTGHYKSSVTHHLYNAIKYIPRSWFHPDAKVSNLSPGADGYKEMPYQNFIEGGYDDERFWQEKKLGKDAIEGYHINPRKTLYRQPSERTPSSSSMERRMQYAAAVSEEEKEEASEGKADPKTEETDHNKR